MGLFNKDEFMGFKKINGLTFGVYKNKKEVILKASFPRSSGKTSEDLLKIIKFEKAR